MESHGPELITLTRRLSSFPDDFSKPLKSPDTPHHSLNIDVGALVNDLVFDAGGDYLGFKELSRFLASPGQTKENYLRIVLLLCYLYRDPCYLPYLKEPPKLLAFLSSTRLEELGKIVDYKEFVTDVERREELSRLSLEGLGLLPAGENKNLAQDRLATLDSIERKKIVQKTKEVLERAQKLKEEMERRAAEEAASKMSRE